MNDDDTPSFDAVDAAFLRAGERFPFLLKIAEMLQLCTCEQKRGLEDALLLLLPLTREAGAEEAGCRLLAEMVQWHHDSSEHYSAMQTAFAREGQAGRPQRVFTLSEVNGMFARHHAERGRALAARLRRRTARAGPDTG